MRIPRPLRAAPAALLLLAAAAGPAAPAGAADPAPPLDATTRDFDQLHLAVRVTPRIAEGSVDGEATLTFASLADPLRTLRLHSEDTSVLGVRDGAGRALEFRLEGGVLSVSLAEPLPRGKETSVTVAYRSRPVHGMYFHAPTPENPDRPLQVYSQGEGSDNRRWIPCYDEPDDRLTVEVFARVPVDLRTVSNGTLLESRPAEGGLREDHWRLDQRIPTYLVSLIAGKFDVATGRHRDVPLEYLGPPGRAEEAREGCSGTPAMMAFFETWLGVPYPYPRYAQTTVWDFVYGGMENASATTMNMRLLQAPGDRPNYSADGLVAHELAHQWFGDLLTCRTWDHLWLNEGFATYFTDLFFESRDGPEEFALHRHGHNREYMDGTPDASKLGLSRNPRGDVPLELFGGKQYDRGAAILHELRLEVGDDAFRRGISRYVRDNADRAVTSEDLRRAVEAEAGRDLRWFFDQWVYGAGYPVLKVSCEFAGAADGPGVARGSVEQEQPGGGGQAEAFRLTVPVRIGVGEDAVRARLDLRRRRQTFDVPLGGKARGPLRFGEGGGLLARVEVRQDRDLWAAMLATDSDVTGRVDAVEALREWPDFAAPRLAQSLAADPCWAVRREAARALGAMGGRTSLDALLAAHSDPDSRVREAAAEALGGRTREEAGTALLAILASDASPYVRAAAARSLGRLRAEGSYEALAALLKVDSHREVVRVGALDGLRALGDPRAVEAARSFLAYNWKRGDQHPMRQAALNLLLALAPDDPDTHAAVVRLLSDPFHRMREWAAKAAGDFLVRAAEPRLREMAASEPFGGVKGAAQAALARIAPPKK